MAGVLATRFQIRKSNQHQNNTKGATKSIQKLQATKTQTPDDIILLGQQGRELITELQRSNWLPPYNVSAFSKVLAFVCFPFSNPATKFKTQQPFLFFFFFFFPHYLALSFLFSRNDFVKSWKKPKHVTMKSLNHWVQTWTCKTKDKRQL